VGEHVKACDFAVVGGATVFLPLSGCLLVAGARNLTHALASLTWLRVAAVVVAFKPKAHAAPRRRRQQGAVRHV
jgi:hypothetical protein